MVTSACALFVRTWNRDRIPSPMKWRVYRNRVSESYKKSRKLLLDKRHENTPNASILTAEKKLQFTRTYAQLED